MPHNSSLLNRLYAQPGIALRRMAVKTSGSRSSLSKSVRTLGVAVGGDSGQADKENASSYLRDCVGTTVTPSKVRTTECSEF